MNRQSKDDFAYILLCACFSTLVFMNLVSVEIIPRFVSLVSIAVWVVFLSHCNWEDP